MGERSAENLEFLDRERNVLDGFGNDRSPRLGERHLHAHSKAVVLCPCDPAGWREVSDIVFTPSLVMSYRFPVY
jgi:hypothetical protein